MKKKDIINLIKDGNSQDVELTYDFKRIADEVGISSTIIIDKKHIKYHHGWQLFFRYATLSLFFVTILLSGFIVYQVNNPIVIEKPPIEETLTKEKLVAKYFEDQNATYITTPIKSQIIDSILINIYVGIIDTEQIIFVYTFENLAVGSNILITTKGKLEGVEENIDIVEYDNDSVFSSSILKIENSFEVVINTKINEQTSSIVIELDIAQFIAYLNK